MKIISVALLILCTSYNSFSQTLTPVLITPLPSVIGESSGVEVTAVNSLWSHNDGSGLAEIYRFDTTGILLHTLGISNATNVDWEDLAQDSIGNIFIGDFGNNNNDRQDLKIYIVPNPDTITATNVNAQIINFTYPDQFAFPPAGPLLNFDMEAFFWFNHSLYLFSKNRTNPYDGYTKLYKLPDVAGTYVAQLLDSFYTGAGPWPISSITSADISPDNSCVVLITGTQCWLFGGFVGDDFFGGNVQPFVFNGSLTQKEGVCFSSNTGLYITDEKTGPIGGNLYFIDISSIINSATQIDEPKGVAVFPNPIGKHISILVNEKEGKNFKMEIYNIIGEIIFAEDFLSPNKKRLVNTENFASGAYLLKIIFEDGETVAKKIVKQ